METAGRRPARGLPGAAGRQRSLQVLEQIARLLNSRADIDAALEEVLGLVTRLLGLSTAWVFLVEPPGRRLSFAAAHGLPPALEAANRRPLRRGWCSCFDLFYGGKLATAVNVVECSRLDEAEGDRRGLVYHASVPLRSTGGVLGVLNVAARGEALFDREALHLLTAVGDHLGTALERSRLFARERRRAANFEAVDRISRALGSPDEGGPTDPLRLASRFARECVGALGLDAVSVALADAEGCLRLAATAVRPGHQPAWAAGQAIPEHSLMALSWRFGRLHFAHARGASAKRPGHEGALPGCGSWAAVPVAIGRRRLGAILFERQEAQAWQPADHQALRSLADHLALALEHARLVNRARELAQIEERQRLSRDLHDSVSQNLFSLHMLVAAARHNLAAVLNAGPVAGLAPVEQALRHAEERAQRAREEMRHLVRELRPASPSFRARSGRELLSALAVAVEGNGLARVAGVSTELSAPATLQTLSIGPAQFEALVRVAQEAVHNALKHARARTVRVRLSRSRGGLAVTIKDDGCGFDPKPNRAAGDGPDGHGLDIMAERCRLAGGRLTVSSRPGAGTRVRAWVPLDGGEGDR